MTKQPFDKLRTPPLNDVLDECLTLLEGDQVTRSAERSRRSLEECLARYPQHAADLRPLLEIALEMRRVARPTPSLAAFSAGKRRMLRALDEKKRRQPFGLSPSTSPSTTLRTRLRTGLRTKPSPLSRRREWIAALFGERGGKPATRRRAPAFRVALAAALVLVLLVNGGLFLRSWLGTTVTRMARLDSISGVVEVRPAGSETWLPASSAQRLEAGDRVRTGPLSAARLVFFDDSTTDLEAETEITIAQMISRRDGHGRVITFYQWLGRSHNRVQRLPDSVSRFEIETPATIAVVRGTEFSVAVEADGATQVAVWEGFVEVTAWEKTVQVQPGKMTSVRPDLPPAQPVPAPTRLPPEVFPSTLTQEAETPQPTRTPMPEPTETALSPSTELGVSSAEGTPQPTRTPQATQMPEPTATPAPPTLTPSPTPTPSPMPTETPAPPPTLVPPPTESLPPTPTETPASPPTLVPPPTETSLPPTPTETPAPPPTLVPPPTESSETPTPMND